MHRTASEVALEFLSCLEIQWNFRHCFLFPICHPLWLNKKMQLDVGVSPPANIMTFRPGSTHLTLTHVTFDPDPWPLTLNMTLGALVLKIWIIVQEFLSSHRQTDGQTEIDAYEPTVQCAQVGSKIWSGISKAVAWQNIIRNRKHILKKTWDF